MKKDNLIFLLPVLSGILLILAYPPYNIEILIWIALIPLLYFIKSVSPKKALIGGMITGFIFLGKLFDWVFATIPFDWLGINIEKNLVSAFILLIIFWIIQTLFLSLFFGVFSWAIKKITQPANFKLLFIIPFLWIILEYLRTWAFTVLWIGKETFFGPHWTFGNLAYVLHNNSLLIQIADIVGIYGISFLIVLINAILFFLLLKKKSILFIILVLIILSWIGYGLCVSNYEANETRRIALIQTNFLSGSEFNPYQKQEVFDAVLKLFQSQENPDLIIAPEGFGIISLVKDKELTKYLLKDFYQPGQIFIENEKIVDENGKVKSRLFYYDLEKESPVAFHDKMLLIPNGEFMPYLTKALLSFDAGNQKRLTQRGEKYTPAFTSKGIIGGTICSSIISPNLQRQMAKKGAEFLVVVSSDAPFHGSKALLSQNLAMSKLRAVENRRYFAQATNMGYSFLLDPKGKIVLKSTELENNILFTNIQLINKKTIYTKFGDWILILAILFCLTFKKWYNK